MRGFAIVVAVVLGGCAMEVAPDGPVCGGSAFPSCSVGGVDADVKCEEGWPICLSGEAVCIDDVEPFDVIGAAFCEPR